MKKTNKYILAILILAMVYGCKNEVPYIPLASGLSYKLIEDKEGKKASETEVMSLLLKSLYKDSIVAEPKPVGGFILSPYSGAPPMLSDVLVLLGEGDSAHIKFSLNQYSQLTGMRITPDLDTAESVIMQIRVTEINEPQVFSERIQAEAKKAAVGQLEIDKGLIEAYLAENGIEAQSTEDGLYYVMKKDGKGPKAKAGDLASVNYIVRLIDGTFIDTSYKNVAEENNIYNPQREPYVPYEFPVGQRAVIDGWDLAVPLINQGGSATLFIPSTLAYGATPRPGPIPPNAILMFDVEVVQVKSN
ncbi:MAG: FKBP-type peptidyl-prolyl cis-trans isomerase [Roseivirga sp.]|jgi:FKBP-type peptidyl-prolyl cis-trans isomerase FkpA